MLLHMSDQAGSGDSSPVSTSGRSEAQTSPPETEPDGPIVLDSVTECLVPLGPCTADCEAGLGLASCGISAALAVAVSRGSRSQSQSHPRNPGTCPQDGTRESIVGSAQDPRRATETRLTLSERSVSRYLPAVQRRRYQKALAGFPGNHRKAIVALDFFTVPTLNYRVLIACS